jgi:hypothetical protein
MTQKANFGVQKGNISVDVKRIDPPFSRHDQEAQPNHGCGPRSTRAIQKGVADDVSRSNLKAAACGARHH